MTEDKDRPKVILAEYLAEEAAAWLAMRTRLVRAGWNDSHTFYRELVDADGLLVRTYTRVDREILDAAPHLKVVGRAGVGLDNIDLEACREHGVRVVYTPDANTQAVVEYVFALMLDALRPRLYLQGPVSSRAFHQQRKKAIGTQLDQRVLGVLGVGRIGRRIVRVAHALGMRVICNDVLPPEALGLSQDWPGVFVDKATLWRESDIITIHVDGRPENRRMMDTNVFEKLKPTCLLINAARGPLVDTAALAAWARRVAKQGGGAILDVHDPEPPPEDYLLWSVPNVRLLPHIAARTDLAMMNMSWVVTDVMKVLNGEEPRWAAV